MNILKTSYNLDLKKKIDLELYDAERVYDTFKKLINTFYGEEIIKLKRVVDLGDGDKSFLKFLENKKFNAIGYDIDKINFETDSIPEPTESVDLIICNSVVEHLHDVSNFLAESYRILKKNGIFIIVTPNFYYDYKNFYDDPTHVNPFTETKLYETLRLFNFKSIKVLPWIVKKSAMLWKIPFKFFFCRYILIARNDSKLPLPKFLKGKTKVMVSISKK